MQMLNSLLFSYEKTVNIIIIHERVIHNDLKIPQKENQDAIFIKS
jgi:hypothetical protein